MNDVQQGLCAICHNTNKEDKLCVDHCHVTGKVRGLLCYECNLGLGKFRDNISSLEGAIRYLQRRDNVA